MKKKIKIGDIWGLVYPMLVYYLISMMVSFAVSTVFSFIYIMANPEMADAMIYDQEVINTMTTMIYKYSFHMTFIAAAITTPLLAYFMHLDKKKEKRIGIYKEYKSVNWSKYLLIIPFSLFTMYAANIFVSVLELFMPDFMINSYDAMASAMTESSFGIMLLTAGIMGPIVEELIFRGLVYKRLLRMTSEIWAAIISAALFGIYHGNWIQAPYAFILGLAMAFVYKKYKSIWAPIIFHMSANTFSVVISELAKNMVTEETVAEVSVIRNLIAYLPMLGVFTLLTALLWQTINKNVEAKEINNEIINSSDSML